MFGISYDFAISAEPIVICLWKNKTLAHAKTFKKLRKLSFFVSNYSSDDRDSDYNDNFFFRKHMSLIKAIPKCAIQALSQFCL